MSQIVLYQAVNRVNGKRYVGITKQGLPTRVYKHLYKARNGQGYRLGAAIRKYGEDAIVFSTLVVCPDYRYALDAEMAYIAATKPEYNVTAGGEGVLGLQMSEETRAKLGAANKGNKYWVGRKHKPETMEKLRQRMIGTVGHWRGKKRPDMVEKTRARMLANHPRYWAGKKRSPKTIAKIVATKKANPYPRTEKQRAAEQVNSKKMLLSKEMRVCCITNGVTYRSMTIAAKELSLTKHNIWRVCSGAQKQSHGLSFRYAEND